MKFFDFSFFQQLVSNAIATLIGVALGIPSALWINKYIEKSTERKRKKKILLVLRDELLKNQSLLQDFRSNTTGFFTNLPTKLRDESWKAFSDGGEIEWIDDPELLGRISELYFLLRAIMDLSNKWFDLFYLTTAYGENSSILTALAGISSQSGLIPCKGSTYELPVIRPAGR